MGRKARCEHIEPAIPRTFQIGSPVLSVADSCTATEVIITQNYAAARVVKENVDLNPQRDPQRFFQKMRLRDS
jgi:hypothetical protein